MAQAASRFAGQIDQGWLDRLIEPVLDPALPIIDPHHHLWVRDGNVYLLPELLADLGSGHNVVATVFEECHSMYRAGGPEEEKSLGETEFVTGIAAMGASGAFGASRVCARMVGRVDLMMGDRARGLLERHLIASGGRFAGVRQSTAWDASDRIHKVVPMAGMLADRTFRAGYAGLAALGLVFDAWVYHPQLGEVGDIADAFPHTSVVLNHVGSPILGGPYGADRARVFADWKAGMAALARRPNVTVKLGALPIRLPGDRRVAGVASGVGGSCRRVAPLAGDEHRVVRRRTLHVREQFPGAEALEFVPGDVERVQTDRGWRIGG